MTLFPTKKLFFLKLFDHSPIRKKIKLDALEKGPTHFRISYRLSIKISPYSYRYEKRVKKSYFNTKNDTRIII